MELYGQFLFDQKDYLSAAQIYESVGNLQSAFECYRKVYFLRNLIPPFFLIARRLETRFILEQPDGSFKCTHLHIIVSYYVHSRSNKLLLTCPWNPDCYQEVKQVAHLVWLPQ